MRETRGQRGTRRDGRSAHRGCGCVPREDVSECERPREQRNAPHVRHVQHSRVDQEPERDERPLRSRRAVKIVPVMHRYRQNLDPAHIPLVVVAHHPPVERRERARSRCRRLRDHVGEGAGDLVVSRAGAVDWDRALDRRLIRPHAQVVEAVDRVGVVVCAGREAERRGLSGKEGPQARVRMQASILRSPCMGKNLSACSRNVLPQSMRMVLPESRVNRGPASISPRCALTAHLVPLPAES